MKESVDFQDFVDEVLAKNDIVDLISRYTTLKRVGNRYQALCPLHNDRKTPSFSVSPDKQLFHCFGCGAGGTAIHFIMAKENLDFMEAVKLLADRAGIPIPDYRSQTERTKAAAIHNKKKRMYEMNAEAARYFFSNLTARGNERAIEYLKHRGLSNSTIKSFGIGGAGGICYIIIPAPTKTAATWSFSPRRLSRAASAPLSSPLPPSQRSTT